MNHEKLGVDGLNYLYEGDGYASLGNFVMALQMYEAQIVYLRSKPIVNIKFLAITHGHMGKMFMKQSRYDRAIVDFDRQLSLAKEINDKPEAADAYFGMGSGYLMRNSYDEAIRYLSFAQGRYSVLGNIKKHCNALKLLRDCYNRVGKEDKAEGSDSLTHSLTHLITHSLTH